jgi:ubiquinone/menaquinone biosynthesis C-methylase UbiE
MTTHIRTNPAETTARGPDLEAVKKKQQTTWAAGDYAVVGATLQIVAEELCEAADLRPGQRVLDVATGSGNAAIAAARRFTDVIGVDYVPALLARGRERVQAERLPVDFREGDAESLPFAEASFDAVLSTFGVMFAPDHQRAAGELARVCRPGGRIALASWTPEGVLGESFRLIGRYLPPPAGLQPAVLWGSESHLRELFGNMAKQFRFARKEFVFRFHSFDHWLHLFRTFYGPVLKTFAALDEHGQAALTGELREMLDKRNRSGDATLVYPGEYLEAVVTRA